MAANQLRAPSLMMGFWPTMVSNPTTLSPTNTLWLALGFSVEQAKTLSTVRLFQTGVTGAPIVTDLTCDLFGDSGAGIPGTSIESHAADAVPSANNWMSWSSFATALTPGTQYWLVWKNLNAAAASNNVTYQFIGSAGNQPTIPLGAGGNFNGVSTPLYGWVKIHTTNSGSTWAGSIVPGAAGLRLGFADSTYDGLPIQSCTRPTNGASGDRATGKQEAGVKFSVPAGVTYNVRGAWMPLAKFSTPGNLRFRLYQGTTLLGTTNDVPAGNVTTAAGEGYTAMFPSALTLSSANNPYRLVMSDATAADASTAGYNGVLYQWDADSNSLSLRPMDGTLQKTVTADNTASPPVFTDTAANGMAFALLMDSAGELTSAGGGGTTVTHPTPLIRSNSYTFIG